MDHYILRQKTYNYDDRMRLFLAYASSLESCGQYEESNFWLDRAQSLKDKPVSYFSLADNLDQSVEQQYDDEKTTEVEIDEVTLKIKFKQIA